MKHIVVSLNDAEIKALPTTQKELIPAPGLGKAIVLLSSPLWKTNLVAPYGNISSFADGSFVYIAWNNNETIDSGIQNLAAGNFMNALLENLGGSLILTSPSTVRSVNGNDFNVRTHNLSDAENLPVTTACFNNDGDFNGGNPANTIDIHLWYDIIDV